MASISSLGVGSGLDLSGLLSQLDSAERMKLEPISEQKSTNSAKISAYGSLKSALSKLQSAAATLAEAKTYQGVTSSVSGSGIKVASGSEAVAGAYQVKVDQLAQAQSLATSGFASKTEGMAGAGVLTIAVGVSDPLEVSIAEGSSLEDVRDAINAAKGGVTASIVNDGSAAPYRLVLSSNATGTQSEMNVSYVGTGDHATWLGYDSSAVDPEAHTGVMTQTVVAKDAKLTVNGVSVVSQGNTVEGALQGVTLTLSEAGSAQTLTVARDTETIKSAVTNFVSAYNGLISTASSLGSYDAGTKTAGTLLGDSTLRGMESRMRTLIAGSVGGELQSLTDLGISLQVDGTLKSDGERLDELLTGDLASLSTFFVGSGANGGFASKLDGALEDMLAEDGLLANSIEGLESRNEALDESYVRMESIIDSTIERYRSQFSQLDSLIAQMNSTSSYLTQQFESLSAQLEQ